MKKVFGVVLIIILIIIAAFFIIKGFSGGIEVVKDSQNDSLLQDDDTNLQREQRDQADPIVTNDAETVIGSSVEGRDIVAYHFGDLTSEKEILFVGGIHGGYAWNTVLVARELVSYFEGDDSAIPANTKVTVIPVLNPDGLHKVVGTTGEFTALDVPAAQDATIPGRFNGNSVDLNRNFNCDWQSTGVWRDQTVDAGKSAFSEPESTAIKSYVEANVPQAVVAWYSAAGGVFSSNCHGGVLTETRTLTNLFANASGYNAFEEFDFYEIGGDMMNWLAKNDIPAISVLLTNHQDVEWNKNKAGVEAILGYFAE